VSKNGANHTKKVNKIIVLKAKFIVFIPFRTEHFGSHAKIKFRILTINEKK